MLEELYFPKAIYILAHQAYLNETGKRPEDVMNYCLTDPEFFVEVAFSYVDRLPFPVMKESA